MSNDSPDTLLLGSHSQQEDESLFADIKASDWLVARNVRRISGQDLKQGSSGSILLDDIRAAGAMHKISARIDEPNERHDQITARADPIFLTWVKSAGWVRPGTLLVTPPKGVHVELIAELQIALPDGACQSAKPFAVSLAAYVRWMLPQGPATPIWKANR